jgi:hypothetical protein
MKGTLVETDQGWVVRFDQRTWQDPSAEDGELPLLPDDLWVIDHTSYALGLKQEIEFEAITEDIVHPIDKHVIKFTYAKLIHHPVDTNEMINHIGEVNEMVNHVPDVGKMVEDVEKLAEEFYPLNDDLYPNSSLIRKAFTAGYNKAKETLYTEEQVREIVEKSRATGLTAEYIMLSLKQSKQ